MEIIPVIIKWEGGKNGNPILFFPTYSANQGNIVCYQHIGQHSEASMTYYKGLRSVRSPDHIKQAKELLDEYTSRYPDDVFKVVKRDTAEFKEERWTEAYESGQI